MHDDGFIHRANLSLYQRQLLENVGEARRHQLSRLLSEEQAKDYLYDTPRSAAPISPVSRDRRMQIGLIGDRVDHRGLHHALSIDRAS